ncbi:hypothetical protein HUE46_01195 [Flavobacterium columnare]|uniref:hypothetical protein n=1 Tax=Flavobacterium columnare TaxID=996 RepID=UPI0017811E2B|nr:hypothetical protein [Flavobacterium columnare]MBF6654792.1 hypothetical protein [Flavobacterium columnare]QOG88741.1 hypothetical protein HUE41_01195 [Flavobacterium columnare]QOG91400.1 hypothetical protein HUE42_01190 [Flavobacterium columnare]QOG94063.1 hypothetical protein HUE43_01195 [Flavobacterium columnare]QOG96722.1 hypothetical protein HUE44_01190 [Flavobacterium columnare]
MQHNFNNPIYEISINSRECAIALKVNDIPCFSNFNKGGMAVNWPINTNILHSGKQSFLLKVFPFEKEIIINNKAFIELQITVRDRFDTSKSKISLLNFDPVYFSKQKENIQYYTILDEFDAHVPYSHRGWIDSMYILDEKKEDLIKQIDIFYDELYHIFKTSDIEKYKLKISERYPELCNSFYLSSLEIENRKVSLIPKFKGMIKRASIEKYNLNFYGNGRVVGVNIPFEPVALKFFSDNEEDNIIYEQALFHRKKNENKLSLIR